MSDAPVPTQHDGPDPELDALRVLAKSLDGLDRQAQGRVVRWAVDRYAPEAIEVVKGDPNLVWSYPTSRPIGLSVTERYPCGHCRKNVTAQREHACVMDPVEG